jgi:prepilin-type N-terminal cleavage/methylation domain-containing protein
MRCRKGFTLIELMVSMTLTLFVMAILSQAFVLALETFSGLKGIGDLQANLRTAANLLRSDLAQDHLEGKRRLSDPGIFTTPPREGFFAIRQAKASIFEGESDIGPRYGGLPGLDSVKSFVAVNHVIHMAVKRKGNRRESFFNTQVSDFNFFSVPTMYGIGAGYPSDDATFGDSNKGAQVYGSQWAEIVYFLMQTGTVEEPSNPSGVGAPLFGLYRGQLVCPPDVSGINNKFANGGIVNFAGLTCETSPIGPNIVFFSPNDLANPGTRVYRSYGSLVSPPVYSASSPFLRGATLALPNVLSFQVQVMGVGSTANTFVDVANFDSATSPFSPVSPFSIRAVQITLRVWDSGTKQARQVTVVQDL